MSRNASVSWRLRRPRAVGGGLRGVGRRWLRRASQQVRTASPDKASRFPSSEREFDSRHPLHMKAPGQRPGASSLSRPIRGLRARCVPDRPEEPRPVLKPGSGTLRLYSARLTVPGLWSLAGGPVDLQGDVMEVRGEVDDHRPCSCLGVVIAGPRRQVQASAEEPTRQDAVPPTFRGCEDRDPRRHLCPGWRALSLAHFSSPSRQEPRPKAWRFWCPDRFQASVSQSDRNRRASCSALVVAFLPSRLSKHLQSLSDHPVVAGVLIDRLPVGPWCTGGSNSSPTAA
jgi:hypothetical protein